MLRSTFYLGILLGPDFKYNVGAHRESIVKCAGGKIEERFNLEFSSVKQGMIL
jgi:hypothetical protein